MKRLEFDTEDGRGFLDAVVMNVTNAKLGDVLVIRYGGDATPFNAREFLDRLMTAWGDLVKRGAVPKSFNPVPVVIARDGVYWALEPMDQEPKSEPQV